MDEELAMAIKVTSPDSGLGMCRYMKKIQCDSFVQTLWTDDNGIKQAYDRRAEFQLNDSAS